MVQELHVLRCFSCETFQSHIVKKTNKWECKLCGVKQSIKKVYGRGSGKDCRIHTQKLNALKGQKEETESPDQLAKEINEPKLSLGPMPTNAHHSSANSTKFFNQTSKWAEFIDENATSIDQNHLTKPTNTNFTPCESFKHKAQKRKISDEFVDEEFEGYSHDFDSIDNKYSTFSNTCSQGYTKNIQSNKHYLSKNNRYNNNSSNDSVDSESNTQGISRKYVRSAPFQAKLKNQIERSSKWAGYLEHEDETDLLKTTTQNTAHVQPKDTKISLKWAKYLGQEDEFIFAGTSSTKTSPTHRAESDTCLKKLKSAEGLQEERGTGSLNHFGRMVSDDCGRLSSDDSRRVSLNHLQKSSINHFVNSETVPIRVTSITFNNGSVNLSDSSCRNNYKTNTDANNSWFDSNNYKQTDSPGLGTLKNNFSKEVQNNLEEISLKEKENSKTIPSLPVFEQYSELCDSDFQLDF